jgi:hypothetical protein
MQTIGATGDLQAKLLASDGLAEDWFGISTAIDGNIALIGAPQGSSSTDLYGKAYLFDISDPANPVELSVLVASDGDENDSFGTAVCVSGDIAVVSSPVHYESNYDTGYAVVFDINDPMNPVEMSSILPSDRPQEGEFGYAMAMSGNMLVVGAYRDFKVEGEAGSAYLYDLSDPANPIETSKITAAAPTGHDRFGISVAIDGDLVVIGAPDHDSDGENAGAAFLFDISDPFSPVEKSRLLASSGFPDLYGWSVAIVGNFVLVGAPGSDCCGSAYLMDVSDPVSPVEWDLLRASDAASSDAFGRTVALSHDRAIVGSPQDDDYGNSTGSIYIFDTSDPSDVTEIIKVVPAEAGFADLFGDAIAMGDRIAVVGTFGDDDNGDAAGAVYLVEVVPCDGDANGDNAVDVNDISYVLFRLGDSGSPGEVDGDANGDGTVDVNDISYVLFRLGDPC